MAQIKGASKALTVSDPNSAYLSMKSIWQKNRAICSGERFVKEVDGILDRLTFSNLLIPFSPSMSDAQYRFYKAEAELPGLVALYVKFVIGGLLRKQPQFEILNNKGKDDIKNWILNDFTRDGQSLASFLNEALSEEIQTGRPWVFVDYPKIENPDKLTTEEFQKYKPYPVLIKAESIINWKVSIDPLNGQKKLQQVLVRTFEEDFTDNEFHPKLVDTVLVHEIFQGNYRIRKYQNKAGSTAYVVNGKTQEDHDANRSSKFELIETIENILYNGNRLKEIPAWPLNGRSEITEPLITPLVDREVSLYNKISRRNHLLYGAATYTPIISDDISDEQFTAIVNAGLGSWIKLNKDGKASVLETPTEALQDMDRAITSTVEEMARMGIRMLSPETAESGIALDIRNASQTATLGLLNSDVSNTMARVIVFMINWRYNLDLIISDIQFTLSADFNPAPIGADWLRLVTEWYREGLLPRSVWLQILKQNDIVPSEYDDKNAIKEINDDDFIAPKSTDIKNGIEEN